MRERSKKLRIIESAVRLWQATHNINKVSLADIAREASVSPTTIYNQFQTRDGLIREVIRYLTEKLLESQWAIIKSDLPFPLKIQQTLNAKMSSLEGMQSTLLEKFSSDPVAKNYLDQIYEDHSKPMMMTLIQEGKQQGYIHPDLDEDAVMLYLDILKAGGVSCADKLQKFLKDPDFVNGLTRIIYFGLFQKEFDFKIFTNIKEKK